MSHARPDPTTVSAASATPRTRAPSAPRGAGSADEPTVGTSRRQVLLVANVIDPPAPEEVAARVPSGDVLGHAVVDVHEVSEAFGGETIAVLGRHVVAAFPYDQAADAVTAAVEIQRDAARSAREGHEWSCSVCLVAGDVVDDPAFERIGVHPVGPVVVRALQLSQSTSPGSVLADEQTVLPAARPGERASVTPAGHDAAGDPDAGAVVGTALSWSLGAARVVLEQSEEPLSCYEIEFDAHTPTRAARVSVSTSSSTRSGSRNARGSGGRRGRGSSGRGQPRPPASASQLRRRPWSEGRVFCWFSDRGRGVITSTTGQEFYVDRRFLAVGSELSAGDHVFFVPRDPVARGRNPVAGSVLADGARLEVRIERATEDGSALAIVSDSNGTDQVLPLDVTSVGPVAPGEWLLVKVSGAASSDGPLGKPV